MFWSTPAASMKVQARSCTATPDCLHLLHDCLGRCGGTCCLSYTDIKYRLKCVGVVMSYAIAKMATKTPANANAHIAQLIYAYHIYAAESLMLHSNAILSGQGYLDFLGFLKHIRSRDTSWVPTSDEQDKLSTKSPQAEIDLFNLLRPSPFARVDSIDCSRVDKYWTTTQCPPDFQELFEYFDSKLKTAFAQWKTFGVSASTEDRETLEIHLMLAKQAMRSVEKMRMAEIDRDLVGSLNTRGWIDPSAIPPMALDVVGPDGLHSQRLDMDEALNYHTARLDARAVSAITDEWKYTHPQKLSDLDDPYYDMSDHRRIMKAHLKCILVARNCVDTIAMLEWI